MKNDKFMDLYLDTKHEFQLYHMTTPDPNYKQQLRAAGISPIRTGGYSSLDALCEMYLPFAERDGSVFRGLSFENKKPLKDYLNSRTALSGSVQERADVIVRNMFESDALFNQYMGVCLGTDFQKLTELKQMVMGAPYSPALEFSVKDEYRHFREEDHDDMNKQILTRVDAYLDSIQGNEKHASLLLEEGKELTSSITQIVNKGTLVEDSGKERNFLILLAVAAKDSSRNPKYDSHYAEILQAQYQSVLGAYLVK